MRYHASMSHRIELFPTYLWGFSLAARPHLAPACADALRALREDDPGVQKSNLLGWQSSDELHLQEPFSELSALIEQFVATQVAESYPKVQRFEMMSMWGNINPPGAANLGHTHEHTVSGVFYLEVPADSGRLSLCDPRIRNMGLAGEERYFSVAAQPHGVLMFPAWLEHFVEPNLSGEERLSVAFNLKGHL
jgi:uncharacterized protein (TIGR02466 family)